MPAKRLGAVGVIGLAVGVGALNASAATIYVDDDAPLGGDGLTWDTALVCPHDALALAVSGDEIRVAGGTYRTSSPFSLRPGIGLYGGYAGFEAADPDERNIVAFESILSGDWLGDDGPDFSHTDDNSDQVVDARYTDRTSIIEGFTISNGYARYSGGSLSGGAGMNCGSRSPTVRYCTFRRNSAPRGGAVFVRGGQPTFLGCTFVGNRAPPEPHGAYGGAVFARDAGTELVLVNCEFLGNSCYGWGGAIYIGRPGSATITNSRFSGNAAIAGGAIFDVGRATLVNCTITSNRATQVPAACAGVQTLGWTSRLSVQNCILWGNSNINGTDESAQLAPYTFSTSVDHSCVQGWTGQWLGTGSIGDDPLFIDSGYWDDGGLPEFPLEHIWYDGDFRLQTGSAGIDAGDNDSVPNDIADLDDDGDVDEPLPFGLDGLPRFVDDPMVEPDTGNPGLLGPPVVDMGAYEFQRRITTHLDIKPGSCPNPVNVRAHGVVPIAIVGTEYFDVSLVDVDSLELIRADGVGGGVAPTAKRFRVRATIEDVATPFDGELCDCHDGEGDGIDDLAIKFSTAELVGALELVSLENHSSAVLTIRGDLVDGTSFEASDCITIRGNNENSSAKRSRRTRGTP